MAEQSIRQSPCFYSETKNLLSSFKLLHGWIELDFVNYQYDCVHHAKKLSR